MNSNDSGEFTLSTQSIFIHPNYEDNSDGSDQNFDFCLLQMDESIIDRGQTECSGDCVAIACMPSAPPGDRFLSSFV